MRKEYIQLLAIGRNQGIEVLKTELEKLEREDLKKTAKSNGYLGSFGRMSRDEIIQELYRWIGAKLNYGTCFRTCSEDSKIKK